MEYTIREGEAGGEESAYGEITVEFSNGIGTVTIDN